MIRSHRCAANRNGARSGFRVFGPHERYRVVQRRHRRDREAVPARSVERKPKDVEIATPVETPRAHRVLTVAGFGAVAPCNGPRMPLGNDERDLDAVRKRVLPFVKKGAHVTADAAMISEQVPRI